MGAKCKSRGIQKMRGTPGLAALVLVVWAPLLLMGFPFAQKTKKQGITSTLALPIDKGVAHLRTVSTL
jgi:hypothetical protein